MRIIHFTYTIAGGAGNVVNKFHQLLRRNGFESAIINAAVDRPADGIYLVKGLQRPLRKMMSTARYWLFRLWVRLRYKKSRLHNFTYNYNYRHITLTDIRKSLPFKPDIIFLHWIADFITPALLQQLYDAFQCPVIWRYNDLAPVSGGCHYLAGCDHYKTGCGHCPALGSSIQNDWSRKHWADKSRVLPGINLTVINSTHHTEAVFKQSPLFAGKRQEFIRNSVPEALLRPVADKAISKSQLGLPAGKNIIFWGATHITEQRKGFAYLLESMQELNEQEKESWYLVIAGNKPADYNPAIPAGHRFTGLLNEQQLAAYYQASDVIACTSLEDGGPMMIIEALLCGTPVVSFATGLALELVITGETGYRAEKLNAKDLAKGLSYVLNLPPAEQRLLSVRCHEKAASLYGESIEISAYRQLFDDLIQKRHEL